MITKSELISIARLKGISNIGYAEKDYLLDLALFLLCKNMKQELIFKGGTALYKIYKFERFSEDLDFSEIKTISIDLLMKKIISDLSKFGIEAEISRMKEPFNSVLITLKAKGPLYDGRPQTLASIRIDINRKSKIELETFRSRIASIYTEIPQFDILVMQEKEILAEKIRAIMTRNKARDLYDAYFLMRKNVDLDLKLVNKKLEYYKIKFDKKRFMESVGNKRGIWVPELNPLIIGELPDFKEVEKYIFKKIKDISD
ncbi:MAG: nucleotidyl transferase AbiEii/AbiGii toxin family protein [Nanoarchaeota archaeon]|nr:nucleotidyl transferase AbiEii/AbiGii toxin family protein [Nanoarchaeota archaeon]MBU0962543.1 nucleotidyl transferase AbiEii/AbiGii toxin family protein [Nanoarchaeota archaeon]